MMKSGQSNLTKRPHCHTLHMDGSLVFIRWCQCAPHVVCASLGPSTRVHNPNGISVGSAIFAQLMAECRQACLGMSFPLKISTLHGAIWTPNTWFLGPTQVLKPNGISISSVGFAGLTALTEHQTLLLAL